MNNLPSSKLQVKSPIEVLLKQKWISRLNGYLDVLVTQVYGHIYNISSIFTQYVVFTQVCHLHVKVIDVSILLDKSSSQDVIFNEVDFPFTIRFYNLAQSNQAHSQPIFLLLPGLGPFRLLNHPTNQSNQPPLNTSTTSAFPSTLTNKIT